MAETEDDKIDFRDVKKYPISVCVADPMENCKYFDPGRRGCKYRHTIEILGLSHCDYIGETANDKTND